MQYFKGYYAIYIESLDHSISGMASFSKIMAIGLPEQFHTPILEALMIAKILDQCHCRKALKVEDSHQGQEHLHSIYSYPMSAPLVSHHTQSDFRYLGPDSLYLG